MRVFDLRIESSLLPPFDPRPLPREEHLARSDFSWGIDTFELYGEVTLCLADPASRP